MSNRKIGIVKFFDKKKGFGFIAPKDGSKDVFVHENSVADGIILTEKMEVEFTLVQDQRGLKAEDVSV